MVGGEKLEESLQIKKSRAISILSDQYNSFFHTKANERRVRKEIKRINDENGEEVIGREGAQKVILNYSGSTQSSTEAMEEVLECLESRVTTAMNEELTKPFTSEEITQAFRQMHPSKSPRWTVSSRIAELIRRSIGWHGINYASRKMRRELRLVPIIYLAFVVGPLRCFGSRPKVEGGGWYVYLNYGSSLAPAARYILANRLVTTIEGSGGQWMWGLFSETGRRVACVGLLQSRPTSSRLYLGCRGGLLIAAFAAPRSGFGGFIGRLGGWTRTSSFYFPGDLVDEE
ncbi:hypothetical protein Sango_0640600 [Sesamum angolense]|uniref:Uncharacterized protein n=1 Tax=Sesamum angolense TaxID=2727404 RepID=A0AAE2C276_9LAMI|nr:hypothetical protein Sango_0640600 [Sesamum angolense]